MTGAPVETLAAPGTGSAAPENLLAVYASADPIEPGQIPFADLEKTLCDFRHAPYDRAGFNAISLPFDYVDETHHGGINEALAFGFLMSFDLDWSPGCYCSRHAFYISQHDAQRVRALEGNYTPNGIASLVARWHGTHAVGGTLTRGPTGYTGALHIFDAAGKLVFAADFKEARSYWDLLGDMDFAAMTFLDVAPSPALAQWLHKPRCTQAESLMDLGSTAFMPEGPPGAYDVYQKILRADPAFAVVRAWCANQQYVRNRDARSQAAEEGLALSIRVEPPALLEFFPNLCADRELAAEYNGELNDAAALASEDNPLILHCRLSKRYFGDQAIRDILARGLDAVAKYPNAHGLVLEMAMNLASDDPWLAAGLFQSALRDRYLPGFNDRAAIMRQLAYACGDIDRFDLSMQLLSQLGAKQPKSDFYHLLAYLACAGRYTEALGYYQLLGPRFDTTDARWMAPYASFCAVVADKPDILDQILHEQHQALVLDDLERVFQGFRDVMDKKPIDRNLLAARDQDITFPALWRVLLTACDDASEGNSAHHALMSRCNYDWPLWRFGWIAQDDYQRRDPSADAASFYDYLDWFYPQDPWVHRAVLDFRARTQVSAVIDAETVRVDLTHRLEKNATLPSLEADWSHVLTPWRVAACVHQLLNGGDVENAKKLARMYLRCESLGTYNNGRHAVAEELVHKADSWGE